MCTFLKGGIRIHRLDCDLKNSATDNKTVSLITGKYHK